MMQRRRRFQVAISKQYFPQSLWPDNNYFAYRVVTVLAISRRDAAEVAWQVYGEKWLKDMFPTPKVRLYAAPLKKKKGLESYQPITVYEKR